MNFKIKLLAGNGATLLLMAVVSTILYSGINSLITTSYWVEHTHEAINSGNSLVAHMVDQETGMRGFLVTGKDGYLEPYIGGQKAFKELIKSTKLLVSDNPIQVSRLDSVETMANQWLTQVAEPYIERRRALTSELPLTELEVIVAGGEGKQYMDKLRVHIAEFTAAEETLMKTRSANAEETANWSSNFAIYGTVITVLGVCRTFINQ